jgi:hypothetical protein
VTQRPRRPVATPSPSLREAAPVQPVVSREKPRPAPGGPAPTGRAELTASLAIPGVPDSLFDHSEDVEFILDPVTLHRGRASMTRTPSGVRGEKAVISF